MQSVKRLITLEEMYIEAAYQATCYSRGLTRLLTTQEAFVDIVNQDQTIQNVQSDLWSTVSTFPFSIIIVLFLHLAMTVFLANEQIQFIYLFGSERDRDHSSYAAHPTVLIMIINVIAQPSSWISNMHHKARVTVII